MPASLMVAIRVAAPPERAFDAFVGEIGAWWQPSRLLEFTRGRSGVLSFEPGETGRLIETYEDGSVFEIGKITAWEPPAHLGFNWRQASFRGDQLTHVRVRFEAAGERETRVVLEHSGWDSVPQKHVARHGFPLDVFQQRHAEWWQALLGNYKRGLAMPGGETK
ncbi:MAG TPA: SRPBCC domain-containing protein [Dehalococcoidia bacterium]|jgi:uncharacterized protein YndB with AHSA1/START domain|nr:SRPBCC domain-containing protein [Dehalococcoidia bacterium]